MLFAGLLCFFMFIDLKQTVAQEVQVPIFLPYSGRYNEWDITLTNRLTGFTYEFHTTNATFNTFILGTVTAGNYDITYDSSYFPRVFDFGVSNPNYYHWRQYGSSFIWFNAPIDENTILNIDEGY